MDPMVALVLIVLFLLLELQYGFPVGLASLTLLPVLPQPALLVLLQTVLRVLLQTVRGAARVTAAPLQERPLPEQEGRPLSEQEQHPLLEQVLEPATDGQEAEAPHRNIFTMKTALILAVLLTLHVLPERVVHVQPELVVIVQPGHARLVRPAVVILYPVLLAIVAPMQQVLQEPQVDTMCRMYLVKDLFTIAIADVIIQCIMVVYT